MRQDFIRLFVGLLCWISVLAGSSGVLWGQNGGNSLYLNYEIKNVGSYQWSALNDTVFLFKKVEDGEFWGSTLTFNMPDVKGTLYYRIENMTTGKVKVTGSFVENKVVKFQDASEDFNGQTEMKLTLLCFRYYIREGSGDASGIGGNSLLYYDMDGDGWKEYFINSEIYKYGIFFSKWGTTPVNVEKLLNVNNDILPEYSTDASFREKIRHHVFLNEATTCTPLFQQEVYAGQLDLNADGLPDFIIQDGKRLFTLLQHLDHNFVPVEMDISSVGESDYTNLESWHASLNGMNTWITLADIWAQMMSGYATGENRTLNGNLAQVDFNKDGLPDIVDAASGTLFLNKGKDNGYSSIPLQGRLIAKDLNGDYVVDYILYDESKKKISTLVYQGNGEYKEQTLIQNLSISNIYCYDLDRDGDVDIVLPFDYTESSGWSFLVVCENDGKGNFTLHEQSYETPYLFGDCVDVDNDGYYDLLVASCELASLRLFRGNGLSFEEPTEDLFVPLATERWSFSNPMVDIKKSRLLDIDNDGRCELIAYVNDGENEMQLVDLDDKMNIIANQAPVAMPAPVYVLDESNGMLRVKWERGQDKETPVTDLTYALRIGSKPGQGDIHYAHANADGRRRRFGEGNMGNNTDAVFDVSGWKAGTYYLAVQAVDASSTGSAWSPETVYIHQHLSSKFNISEKEIGAADTLTVALPGLKETDYTYQWELPDATILESNKDGSILKLRFTKSGQKKLRLQVTDVEGNTSETEHAVYVTDNTMKGLPYEETTSPNFFMDLNGDDVLDGLSYNGFVVNDGKGSFKKLGKIFNSDFEFNSDLLSFLDYDMDGDFDLYSPYCSKGNFLINNGDYNFSFLNQNVTENIGFLLYDWNNDGFIDACNDRGIFVNKGDNTTFIKGTSESWQNQYSVFDIDFNRDGYMDRCSGRYFINYNYQGLLEESPFYIFQNKGTYDVDFTLRRSALYGEEELRQLTLTDKETRWINIDYIEDMNNDGYEDLIQLLYQERKIRIMLGNKEMDYSKEIKDISFDSKYNVSKISFIRDMDNNGYLDFVFNLGESGNGCTGILYFYPDFETKLVVDVNLPLLEDRPFVDLNGDGTPDLYRNGTNAMKASYVGNLVNTANVAPVAPANVRSSQTERGILLQWDDAKDAETPAVQMRYNISVKKKGATGEGAFIISPMNGLKDEAAIIPNYYYHYNFGIYNSRNIPVYYYQKATRKEIPIERFEVGQEYEVQIQSIDLWNAHSPMSEVYTFTVENQVAVLAPEETCLNAVTSVSYSGTEDVSGGIAWNWDGGVVVSGTGSGPYEVTWSAPGVKMVTVSVAGFTSMKAIKVNEGFDLAFNLPAAGLAGCEVNFLLPGLFKDASKTTEIRKSDDAIKILRRTGSLEAKATFPEEGRYWIELSTTDDICGEISNRQYIDIKGTAPTPVIKLVGIDSETGKNKVMWDMPDMPQYVTNVNVYREGSKYNDFELIGSVLPSEGMYIDYTSNPRITASRYRIALDTEYNAESNPSRIHSSTHLMLNKGMGNAVNLVWNQYEGGIVESYRILRGTSKDNLSVLAEVSGANNAYSDLSAGEAVYYYALEYDNTYSDEWKPMGVSARKANAVADASGRSNVVCTDEALNVTLATGLNILALESEMVLTPEQTAIHFYAEIFPVMADYKKVNWQIVEGRELATVNQNGLLAYSGRENGTIIVRATTIDGSDISKEVIVRKKDFTTWASSIEITSQEGDCLLVPEQSQLHLQAAVLPASASQQVEWSIIEGTALATISQDGVVKAKGTDNGAIIVCATALDGSGVYEEVVITKSRFLPSGIDGNRDESVRCRYEKGKVYVEGLPAIGANLLLTDINGRILQEQNTNDDSFTLDVDTYTRGIYLLRIDTGKGRMTFRFVR